MNKMTKLALAASAATLFSTAAVTPVMAGDAKDMSVKCSGINACKGQGKCKTAENACAGQNKCKGHGWLVVSSADECTKQGGSIIK